MKILVTGSEGTIGSRLCERLEKDHEVFKIDNKLGETILDSQHHLPDVELVYHLAAQIDITFSTHFPLEDAMDNIISTVVIANYYKNKKVIYTNSAASLDIKSPYGLSKKTGAEYIKLLCKNYAICTISNLFGAGKGVTEKFKHEVVVNGTGTQTRDFVHIDDIIEALILAIDWQGEFLLGNEESYQIIDLAKATGKPIKYADLPKGEVFNSTMKNTTPNWKPKINVLNYMKDGK